MGILKKLKKKKADAAALKAGQAKNDTRGKILKKKETSRNYEMPHVKNPPKAKKLSTPKGEASTWKRVKNSFSKGVIIQYD